MLESLHTWVYNIYKGLNTIGISIIRTCLPLFQFCAVAYWYEFSNHSKWRRLTPWSTFHRYWKRFIYTFTCILYYTHWYHLFLMVSQKLNPYISIIIYLTSHIILELRVKAFYNSVLNSGIISRLLFFIFHVHVSSYGTGRGVYVRAMFCGFCGCWCSGSLRY